MDLKGYPQWTTPAVCLKNTLPIPCFIISIFLVKLATFWGAKSPDFCFDALKLRPDVFKWESQNGGYPHFMAKKTDTLIYRGIWFVYIYIFKKYQYISYIYILYHVFRKKPRDIKRLSYSRSLETEVMLNNFSYDLFIFCLLC